MEFEVSVSSHTFFLFKWIKVICYLTRSLKKVERILIVAFDAPSSATISLGY